jgi:adenylate kinase
MRMILLGPPGAGKGSQAQNLSLALEVPHISTGDIFRSNIKEGTVLGTQVKAIISAGELVPDGLTVQIVEDRLSKPDCAKGFILDGFPRTIPQAERLDEVLARAGTALDVVVNLKCPDDIIISRISGRRMCACGRTYHMKSKPPIIEGLCDSDGKSLYIREDDKEETVRTRLETYHRQTEPLIAHYGRKDILRDVDGIPAIDCITAEILRMLGKTNL